MELRDFIVTPIIVILIYAGGYIIRSIVTDTVNQKYFLPALTAKIFGALAVGFIYQFYYSGGDTYNFHTYGSRYIWEAFMEDPTKGFKLLTNDGENYQGIYNYTSRIIFFHDPSSFAVIKLAAILDLITFSSYSATAILFSVIGFIGSWLLFKTFYSLLPSEHRLIAIATLFIPSVIFWGSGLLKDTITLAAASAATYCCYYLLIKRKVAILHIAVLILSLYILYVIKIYILLTLLPALITWVFLFNLEKVKSAVLKILLLPFVASLAILLAYVATLKASEDNPKYSLNAIAKTAQVTAYDIRYWTGRDAGSGYSLGELDGTWQSMVKLAPQAVNVSLFRPYLWEVRNPLMLLSALESITLFLLTLYIFFVSRGLIFKALRNPVVIFCLLFSITFAFAVGVSTFNFGTLTRYKIPLLPYYSVALIFIYRYSKSARKLRALEVTE